MNLLKKPLPGELKKKDLFLLLSALEERIQEATRQNEWLGELLDKHKETSAIDKEQRASLEKLLHINSPFGSLFRSIHPGNSKSIEKSFSATVSSMSTILTSIKKQTPALEDIVHDVLPDVTYPSSIRINQTGVYNLVVDTSLYVEFITEVQRVAFLSIARILGIIDKSDVLKRLPKSLTDLSPVKNLYNYRNRPESRVRELKDLPDVILPESINDISPDHRVFFNGSTRGLALRYFKSFNDLEPLRQKARGPQSKLMSLRHKWMNSIVNNPHLEKEIGLLEDEEDRALRELTKAEKKL